MTNTFFIISATAFIVIALYYVIKQRLRLTETKEKIEDDEFFQKIRTLITSGNFNKPVQKIKKGFIFETNIICYVIDIFYDKDNKYALVCPKIFDKLLNYPGVLLINNEEIITGKRITDEDVIKKATSIFLNYKSQNRGSFE